MSSKKNNTTSATTNNTTSMTPSSKSGRLRWFGRPLETRCTQAASI